MQIHNDQSKKLGGEELRKRIGGGGPMLDLHHLARQDHLHFLSHKKGTVWKGCLTTPGLGNHDWNQVLGSHPPSFLRESRPLSRVG